MKYIYITLDAIDAFSSIRQYHSIEYQNGENLYQVLSGNSYELNDKQIILQRFDNVFGTFFQNFSSVCE